MLNHIKSKQFAPTSIKQPFVLLVISKITQLIHLILDSGLINVVSTTIYTDVR
ncbi:hypothetical protein NIES4072_06850 [Nostoc commune NIES-4072]|uniref:Uncharacterized protein n=1 Tax=Nostoc commune NIES-4072 TaxID=2005467 RepID=A0A2R5FEY0_NOSCO|nr:hypothetical protein NIES4070_19980 [Nostoc commune HK-02]GBG17037.1 hypothetical protein NIES4072_06850 [Nostoc commune NIES-4072]